MLVLQVLLQDEGSGFGSGSTCRQSLAPDLLDYLRQVCSAAEF